jgi:hypothetical protein
VLANWTSLDNAKHSHVKAVGKFTLIVAMLNNILLYIPFSFVHRFSDVGVNLKEGDYQIICNSCHTPRGPSSPLPFSRHQGIVREERELILINVVCTLLLSLINWCYAHGPSGVTRSGVLDWLFVDFHIPRQQARRRARSFSASLLHSSQRFLVDRAVSRKPNCFRRR